MGLVEVLVIFRWIGVVCVLRPAMRSSLRWVPRFVPMITEWWLACSSRLGFGGGLGLTTGMEAVGLDVL